MRILCLCEGGNVRSGHLSTLLKDRGHDALQAGVGWNAAETVVSLARTWAEMITVAEPWMRDLLPADVQDKVTLDFCVGPDRWGMALHPELWNDYIERINRLIPEGPRQGKRFFTGTPAEVTG
jgi:hypothetical protein